MDPHRGLNRREQTQGTGKANPKLSHPSLPLDSEAETEQRSNADSSDAAEGSWQCALHCWKVHR